MIAVTGSIAGLTAEQRRPLLERGRATDPQLRSEVAAIIEDVRARGDDALRAQASRFDNVTLTALEAPRAALKSALAALDPEVRSALEEARASIEAFHRAQLPRPLEVEVTPGVRLGRRALPLRRVAVYAPGGRAAYPSSVLMGVVPARVAGVDEVIVCSPAGADGLPHPLVLAAAELAGADRVFGIGGAGAIAALAFGTASVPRVEKVVGPGNAYVSEAKRALSGSIAIDSPAGPSEVLVLADETADPERVAGELLAQAEHDPDAACVLVTTDPALPARVLAELERLLPMMPRRDIIERALATSGALLTAPDMDTAIAFAEEYAPEHLAVMTREPRALLPRLRAAGTIFLGTDSSVAFGDYITGANHVLPTAGLSRAAAGLSTLDFLRWDTYQEIDTAAAARLAGPTRVLATAEGLPAHAFAATLREAGAARDLDNGFTQRAQSERQRAPVLRDAYAAIELYEPGRVPCEVDLSDNTNLFGVAPSVAALLTAPAPHLVTRYPTVWSRALKEAIAERFGVAAENVATGCGSDDLLDSAARAYTEPGDRLVFPTPTFGVVETFARMNALEPVPVPLTRELTPDVEALLAARGRLIYVCSPNNPTGTRAPQALLERLDQEATGIVLLDEAYADFDDVAVGAAAVRSRRTIVVRTFSKAFGLAGLRVGFALGPAALVRELEKSRGPYKVGGLAEAAALAVLQQDTDWVRQYVDEVRANRTRLAAELRGRGVQPLDSVANFLLLPLPNAGVLAAGLREHGVAVRAFAGLASIGNALRVTVGPWSMMQRFLTAFDAVWQSGAREE